LGEFLGDFCEGVKDFGGDLGNFQGDPRNFRTTLGILAVILEISREILEIWGVFPGIRESVLKPLEKGEWSAPKIKGRS
jgi:hypothetical protein